MAVKDIDLGTSIAVIVGPSEQACGELADEIHKLAVEANSRAAEAFAAGRDDHGALYLMFADRLTLLVGSRP